MRNLARLACFGAALGLALGLTGDAGAGKPDQPAGKPGSDAPKTQACTLHWDAEGGGEVGIDAKSWGPLTMTVQADTQLAAVFNEACFSDPEYVGFCVPGEPFSGQGRVGKKQARLDFAFNIPSDDWCRDKGYVEEWDPAVHCRYHLLLAYGEYDRKADDVTFGLGTDAQLYDLSKPVGEGMLIADGGVSLLVDF